MMVLGLSVLIAKYQEILHFTPDNTAECREKRKIYREIVRDLCKLEDMNNPD